MVAAEIQPGFLGLAESSHRMNCMKPGGCCKPYAPWGLQPRIHGQKDMDHFGLFANPSIQ